MRKLFFWRKALQACVCGAFLMGVKEMCLLGENNFIFTL
jgi:hypothetical protein